MSEQHRPLEYSGEQLRLLITRSGLGQTVAHLRSVNCGAEFITQLSQALEVQDICEALGARDAVFSLDATRTALNLLQAK